MKCDFCQSNKLTDVYTVPTTERGMIIVVCEVCGLVQSFETKKKNTGKRLVRTSSDADWGNVRHGKGIRLPKAIEILAPLFVKDDRKEVLDIGSNRGDFVLWISETYPKTIIHAIEPDKHVVDAYNKNKKISLQIDRFENITLPKETFDIIYCSHTLEHAASASAMIRSVHQALRKDGYFFLEIPNIEIIGQSDIVEEFFIDKHTFHFNRELLIDFVKQVGFSVVSGEKDTDVSNITLLLQKKGDQKNFVAKDKKLALKNKKLIKTYKTLLSENKKKLKEVSDKLYSFMDRQKVVLWGGGRIFDALIKYGELKTDKIMLLVDDYLSKYVSEVHGVKLHTSQSLRLANPDVVIILAKNATEEIYQKVKKFGIRHVVRFSDLL
ncbi:MAG TPA: class I SAM-dependent methyltransferase [Patescibacteria group bacterium]|nr:class I SAM-dependent methyltransferase [Patescibacteria group bacterium]